MAIPGPNRPIGDLPCVARSDVGAALRVAGQWERAVTVEAPVRSPSATGIVKAASASTDAVLAELATSSARGLSSAEVQLRRAQWGPNAVASHRARLLPVLWHQLRSPLLTAAVASYFVGERSDAVIIGIIAIRTRRVPFFRSHPGAPLTLAAVGVALVGSVLLATPLAHALGFSPLPNAFFAALVGMVIGYLLPIEVAKRIFYRAPMTTTRRRSLDPSRALRRRAARFSVGGHHLDAPSSTTRLAHSTL